MLHTALSLNLKMTHLCLFYQTYSIYKTFVAKINRIPSSYTYGLLYNHIICHIMYIHFRKNVSRLHILLVPIQPGERLQVAETQIFPEISEHLVNFILPLRGCSRGNRLYHNMGVGSLQSPKCFLRDVFEDFIGVYHSPKSWKLLWPEKPKRKIKG